MGRRRDSNPQPPDYGSKEPPPAQQADSTVKVRDNRRGIVGGCEARVSNGAASESKRSGGETSRPDLLVQGQAWFQFHHLAIDWSGREGSNLQPPASKAGALPLRHVQVLLRTDGRIRTDTDGGLSAVPLPMLGYVSVSGGRFHRTIRAAIVARPAIDSRECFSAS